MGKIIGSQIEYNNRIAKITILLLFEFSLILSTNGCPPRSVLAPCTCHDLTKGLEVTCEGVWPRENLQKVFQNLANNIEPTTSMYLKLKDTDLSVLPPELFANLDIRHLMAHKCSISSIDSSTFRSLTRIDSIDLSENILSQVPDALQDLLSLVSLNLNFNNIKHLQSDAFKGLHSLERLSLFGNKMLDIHPSAFIGPSKNLTRINLGGNQLSKIPTVSLRPLRSLQRLQVHENQIQYFPPDSFFGLESADHFDAINLAHNQIDSLPGRLFVQLKNLSSLDFEGNRISRIDPQAFAGIEKSLEWLKLGENRLQQIPELPLRNLTHLRELDLRDNQIQSVLINDFRHYGHRLKFLYLQKNQISTIDPHAFETLKSLEWLNLSGNRLTTISEQTLEPLLKNLLIFDISDNPLLCSCSILWLDNAASTLNGRNKAANNNIGTMEAIKCHQRSPPSSQNQSSDVSATKISPQISLNIVAKYFECSSAAPFSYRYHFQTMLLAFLLIKVVSFSLV